jgi:adenylate cyclase
MGYKEEIEYKFLVKPELLPPLGKGYKLVQGYLGFAPTVRVRTEEGPDNQRTAYLTIKGSGLVGRDEFEYNIPFEEAQQLLKLARFSLVSKTRYHLPVQNAPDLKWELDIFEGDNDGLVVAELEVPDEDYSFERPAWLGQDVTTDPKYKNAVLAQHPFKAW